MSKTNHRINKDRGEKLGEAHAHKQRRGFKAKANQLIDFYDDDPDEILDDIFDEDDVVTHIKIKRKAK